LKLKLAQKYFCLKDFKEIIPEGFLGHGLTPMGIGFHLTPLYTFKKHMLSMPVGFSGKLIKELILFCIKCSTSILKNAS